MKILKSEIIHPEPRVYKEKATIELEEGDKIVQATSNKEITIGKNWPYYPQTVIAKRTVRKNGMAISPWLFNIMHYSYRI